MPPRMPVGATPQARASAPGVAKISRFAAVSGVSGSAHSLRQGMRLALPFDGPDGAVEPAGLDQQRGRRGVVDVDRQQADQQGRIGLGEPVADALEQDPRLGIGLLGLGQPPERRFQVADGAQGRPLPGTTSAAEQ